MFVIHMHQHINANKYYTDHSDLLRDKSMLKLLNLLQIFWFKILTVIHYVLVIMVHMVYMILLFMGVIIMNWSIRNVIHIMQI